MGGAAAARWRVGVDTPSRCISIGSLQARVGGWWLLVEKVESREGRESRMEGLARYNTIKS